jgi:hypothetical protein
VTFYIGIDESMIRYGKHKISFIYVASFSKDDSLGDVEFKTFKKGPFKKQRGSSIDIDGLSGFLFYVFYIEEPLHLKDKIKQRQSFREGIKQNVRQANCHLVLNLLNITKNTGILNGENIEIKIDGIDMDNIETTLSEKLKERGYDEERVDVEFIPGGDKKVKIINFADAIANSLRDLIPKGPCSPEVIYEAVSKKILESGSPRIKKIRPFHIDYQHFPSETLERIVT